MQEALDDRLSPEALQELYSRMDDDPREADEFARLRSVDRLLKTAPYEHAPQTLALKIMAQIAAGMHNAKLDRLSGLALALGMVILAVTLVPLLVGVSWLLINGLGNATFFNAALQSITNLAAAGAAALTGLVQNAQALLSANPILPIGLLGLIPVGMLWLARLMRGGREGDGGDKE
jgi:anti-sigma factor RsiW